jgi:hypothetical protein
MSMSAISSEKAKAKNVSTSTHSEPQRRDIGECDIGHAHYEAAN